MSRSSVEYITSRIKDVWLLKPDISFGDMVSEIEYYADMSMEYVTDKNVLKSLNTLEDKWRNK